MLTEICQYLRNWFDRKPDGTTHPKYYGEFTIEDGALVTDQLADGQYFRIIGSLFNDGVHQYSDDDRLVDETFTGSVWSMSVSPSFLELAADIAQWQATYGGADSAAMSPYQSESFGGYSYSKGGSTERANNNGGGTTWHTAFADRLNVWRKI